MRCIESAGLPLVSVIMPVYNAERFLEKAVRSVLEQTYTNIELLIVDDCSTDKSASLIRALEKQDGRIRYIEGEQNHGVAYVRNRGIQEAKGRYIALLDSDDVWVPTKIERQVALLVENNAEIAYCSYGFIDENDKPIMSPFIVPKSTGYNKMLIKCVFSCSTIMTDAKLLKEHMFNAEYYHEDFVLWMELMKLPVKAIGDKQVLAHYRQVSGSRSNNKLHAAKHRWLIYREALGLSLIKSCLAFAGYAINAVLKYYF